MSNWGNAPAGRNVDSVTYFAHISGGTAGVTATNIIEGAVVCNPLDSSIDDNQCVLPSGAAVAGVLGVCTDNYGSTGAVEGKPVSIRYLGLVGVNVAASTAVNFGDKLIVANSSGDVKPRTTETTCTIVAEAMETVASQSARGRVLCRLMLQHIP
jgi:hypothetical protein